VPPTVNEAVSTAMLSTATQRGLGPDAVASTPQSLGGEDFAWYLESIPGALARLGVRTPGSESLDIHQATFDVDERAIGTGIRLLVETAFTALRDAGGTAAIDSMPAHA
jgi:amidohydrolase